MRRLLMANWKMALTDDESVALASEYAEASPDARCELAVAPTFTAISAVREVIHGTAVELGAQDAFWEAKGAFTGEVSAAMLAKDGVRYVIVGHSERRALGETDADVARKLAAVREAGMTPVLCVGETAEERAAGERDAVVRRQVEAAVAKAPAEGEPLVIAYEPRWAIGTGTPCEPGDASEAHRLVREAVAARHGEAALASLRVLYGGSVDAANIGGYLAAEGVDGALVGGASLKMDEVRKMIVNDAW